jgi:hypothetical protein
MTASYSEKSNVLMMQINSKKIWINSNSGKQTGRWNFTLINVRFSMSPTKETSSEHHITSMAILLRRQTLLSTWV